MTKVGKDLSGQVQAPTQHHQIFWRNTCWHCPALSTVGWSSGTGITAPDPCTTWSLLQGKETQLRTRQCLPDGEIPSYTYLWGQDLSETENSIKTSPRTACARAGAPSHGIPSSSWDCGRATRASLDLSLPHHLFLLITIFPTAWGKHPAGWAWLGIFQPLWKLRLGRDLSTWWNSSSGPATSV